MDNEVSFLTHASEDELQALSRVLVYAHDEARSLGIETVEQCLDVALQALRAEVETRKGDGPQSVGRYLNISTLQ